MENLGLFIEYETILLGKRKDFSAAYMGKETKEKDALAVIRYAFEELLQWSPTTIQEYASPKLIELLHLRRAIGKTNFPAGLDKTTDLFYLARLLYPDLVQYSKRHLVLRTYQKYLNKEIHKFPKRFFLTVEGQYNACTCFQYAINQFLTVKSIKELYLKFSDRTWGMSFIRKAKLTAPFNDMFEYPIDMLHASLPPSQRNEFYYQYGRFLTECAVVGKLKGGKRKK